MGRCRDGGWLHCGLMRDAVPCAVLRTHAARLSSMDSVSTSKAEKVCCAAYSRIIAQSLWPGARLRFVSHPSPMSLPAR